MATELDKIVTYLEGLLTTKSFTNGNHYIATTRVPFVTKPGMMITYFNVCLPIRSRDSLVTWSCEMK